MLDRLKRAWKMLRAEGQEEIVTPADVETEFTLTYGDLVIGHLRLEGGRWEFRYSEDFRAQTSVQPLIDFPDVDKTYSAKALWPFFMARIPSLSQPLVREAVEREGLDEHSDVQLLRRFGERSISNPFVLVESS